MQKILVTGANGFVGYYTIRQLLKKNYMVIATGKGACRLPFKEDNFIWETLDFTDEEQVRSVFSKHQPEVVIHSGAMSKPDECELHKEAAYQTNVTGTIHLLKAAAFMQSFFIFLSTDFVFDGIKGMYREDDELAPVNYYGETKKLAEEAVRNYTFDWSIIRTVLVYGKPLQGRENILTGNAKALQRGERLKIFSDQLRTPTYVEDLAAAIVSIIENKAKGIFHISGEDRLSPYGMVMAMARHLQLDTSLVQAVTENEFDQPARRPLITGFDISKAKNLLQYRPTSFEQGLRKTFNV
ncbi:MAG TPA: SDR family oxidoreductase [Flavisolibacter sp.]